MKKNNGDINIIICKKNIRIILVVDSVIMILYNNWVGTVDLEETLIKSH